MARVLKTEIPFEKEIAAQIYAALQGDVVKFVLKNAGVPTDDEYWRSRMEGHCMKVDELFEDSVKSILDYDPGLKPTLVEYVISVVMADSDINEEEVNFVYGFGQSIGLSVKEVSTIFADMFQKAFSPSISAIS